MDVISFIRRTWGLQKYLLTFLLFVVIVGFLDENNYVRLFRLESENEQLREELDGLWERYEAEGEEIKMLETNPEAIERMARVRHFMKTLEEDIYVIEP